MKIIRYKYCNRVNIGTEENPIRRETLIERKIPYSEANVELAKREAYNGEYTIEDDGMPEPEVPETGDVVTWDELDAAYQEGYQEGVDSV